MVISRSAFTAQINECDYIGWQCARLDPPQSAFCFDKLLETMTVLAVLLGFEAAARAMVLLCKSVNTQCAERRQRGYQHVIDD